MIVFSEAAPVKRGSLIYSVYCRMLLQLEICEAILFSGKCSATAGFEGIDQQIDPVAENITTQKKVKMDLRTNQRVGVFATGIMGFGLTIIRSIGLLWKKLVINP